MGVICSRSLPPKNGRFHSVTAGRQNPAKRQADRSGGDIAPPCCQHEAGERRWTWRKAGQCRQAALCVRRAAIGLPKCFSRSLSGIHALRTAFRRNDEDAKRLSRRAERYAARDEVAARAKTKRRQRLPRCCRWRGRWRSDTASRTDGNAGQAAADDEPGKAAARYDTGRRQAVQLRSWTRWAKRGAAMKPRSLPRQGLHHHAGALNAPQDAIPVGNCSYSRA